MSSALYVLSREFRDAAEKLADLDLPPEVIRDTLDSISGDLEAKATATACVIRNMESLAAQIKEAEAGMALRRKALESRAKSLSDYLLSNMQFCGISKVESPHFALTIKKNPPAVVINEPGLIPLEFMKQPPPPEAYPDKAAIKDALKAGKEVPGAHLESGVRLSIA